MSRLSTLSSAAIKAMFSSETDEALIMLITIYSTEDNTTAVARLADGFTGRLQNFTTDDEVIYGVTSNGHDFIFLPIQIGLPGEQETGASGCSIVCQYVTDEAINLIRTELNAPARVSIELVLSGSPNTVEASFPDFYITNATYSAESITLDLTMINLAREPFPCYNFIPSYFPGLF